MFVDERNEGGVLVNEVGGACRSDGDRIGASLLFCHCLPQAIRKVLVGRWHLRLQKARLCAYYCGRLVNGCCLRCLKK